MKSLKRYFIRGLAVLLPAAVTIWIFIWIYKLIQNTIGWLINKLIVLILTAILQPTDTTARQGIERFWLDGLGSLAGFIIALVIVFILGIMLANVIGRRMWRSAEQLIGNLPMVRRVYPYVKQVSDFLLSQDEKTKFISRVVAFEYPRRGIWTVGFVTGRGMKYKDGEKQSELISILVPTAPSPLSGYMVLIPEEDVVPLDMTVEEAMRFVISDGVITPSYIIDEAGRGKV